MNNWYAVSVIIVVVGLAGCSENKLPPAGPLGPLPSDPQAAAQFRKDAEMRVLRETKPSDAEFRAHADFIKSQIRSSEMVLEPSWEPANIAGGQPVCRIDVHGLLKMPTNYGPPGATCSCVVMLEWQDPNPNGKPLNLGGKATMAHYSGSGEGTYEAVIRMPNWKPGHYLAILRINQRDVERKELDIMPQP